MGRHRPAMRVSQLRTASREAVNRRKDRQEICKGNAKSGLGHANWLGWHNARRAFFSTFGNKV
jgi:hypothetical protein